MFIFIKQSVTKITWSRIKLNYNTNYRKGLKNIGITTVIKSFLIPLKNTLLLLQK